MRRFVLTFVVVLLMAAAAYGPHSGVEASSHAGAAAAKKVCKKVTKRVNGKTVKVKVCTNVTPTPKPTTAPTLTPTPVDVEGIAEGIADDVTQAQDPDDRYHTVLEAMQQLNVGVYDAEGNAVNRGGETGDADLYTYDFELRGISQSLDLNRTWGMSDVARILKAQNIQDANGQPIDADGARVLIENAVKAAVADPHNPSVLSLLLLRQLGLRHTTPYDLGQSVPTDQIQLDALQLALITLEFDIPLAVKARATAATQEVAAVHNPGGGEVCGEGINGTANWLFTTLPVTDNNPSVLPQLVSTFHQVLLGVFDVAVQGSAPTGTSTSYGRNGQPGPPLRFVTTVSLLSSPEEIVQCGILQQLNLPKAGPLAGAQISWDAGGLDKYGSVTYAPPNTTTGGDGTSTLVFQPKDEANAGGAGHTDAGTAQAHVTSLAGIDPTVKSLLDFASLFPAIFGWQVTYHTPTP